MGLGLVIGGIAAVGSLFSAKKSYDDSKRVNKQAEADKRAAYKASNINLATLQNQIQQVIEQQDNETFDRHRQGMKDRSKILAAAGEVNVAGNSLMRMVAANMFDESRDTSIQRENLRNIIDQTALNALDIKARAGTSAAYASSQRTNPFLNALTVGTQGLGSAFQVYNTFK